MPFHLQFPFSSLSVIIAPQDFAFPKALPDLPVKRRLLFAQIPRTEPACLCRWKSLHLALTWAATHNDGLVNPLQHLRGGGGGAGLACHTLEDPTVYKGR